jgi:hypothetical protein
MNSVVSGFGQSGFQLNNSEYFYVIHNTIFGNSRTQCDAQGSGISLATLHTISGYTPTADDKVNPNPLLGPTWVVGNSFFHNVLEWNVLYNNALTKCGTATSPFDTDGNGIIFDSNLTGNGDSENYPSPSLTAFNITYDNGGGGIHLFFSAHVTVANNSCYNNYLDPFDQGSARGCMDESQGFDSHFINNIAVAIPTPVSACAFNTVPYAQFNSAMIGSPQRGATPLDSFNNNITFMTGKGCNGEIALFNGDTYSATANKEATNPMWVNVGTTSQGSETTPPSGTNFALQAGSPAIGYGVPMPYLPASAVDVGACSSTLTTCP